MKNKTNTLSKETQEKALEILKNSEDKSNAIVEVIEMINSAHHADFIEQLQREDEEYKANSSLNEKLGLRTNFSANEKAFYEKLMVKQAFTFTQEDIIPTEIVDRTLDDVKKESETLKLVRMAPANVKKWIVASKTGAAGWGGLTDKLTKELSAEIKSLNIEVNKLHALLIIPKAVRDLSMPFVDKYFTAILAEAMHDGLVDGYLNGDGLTGPIGIFKLVNKSEEDGTKSAKTVATTLKGFTPKMLAPVKKFLSKDGKRAVPMLYLIANPSDVYEYVEPALYFLTANGYVCTSKTKIEVIEEPICALGKAIFTIDDAYVMGMQGVNVNEYKETLAVDDADLIIAKAYANGRAVDDNTAYPFDVTMLEEYVPTINSKTAAGN